MSTLANFCTGQWKGAYNNKHIVSACVLLQRWAPQICSLSYAATWKIPKKERINKSLALKSVFGISLLFIRFVVVFPPVVGYLYCVWCVCPLDRTSLHKLLFFYFTQSIFFGGRLRSHIHMCWGLYGIVSFAFFGCIVRVCYFPESILLICVFINACRPTRVIAYIYILM